MALLGVGAFGIWQDGQVEAQQGVHAEVARVLSKLPDEPSDDTDWSSYAKDIEAIAGEASGPGAVYAAVQAAMLYQEGESEGDALRAWPRGWRRHRRLLDGGGRGPRERPRHRR